MVSNLGRMLGKGWSTAQSRCFPVILHQGNIQKGDIANECNLEQTKVPLVPLITARAGAMMQEAHS